MISRFATTDHDFTTRFTALLSIPGAHNQAQIANSVREILHQVQTRGDAALIDATEQFDGWSPQQGFAISAEECQTAWENLAPPLKHALQNAHQRILRYHQAQYPQHMPYTVDLAEDGGYLRYREQALNRVALYVPGGKASYPSSVLMNAIPAQVAGVKTLIMLTPTPAGVRNPTVLAVAHLCGIHQVLAIGGAQAVGAVAYGTETIAPCDKIVGPGNAFVAEAKRQVFGKIGIDMIAGPSEVVIISDGSGDPHSCAADLLAQAEHDAMAQSILLCPSPHYLAQVDRAIHQFLLQLPRRDIIEQSLKARGALIQTQSLAESIDLANRLAPEHLILAIADAQRWEPQILYAGGIFLGHDSCEVLGDYCAGTNHVLPTYGSARFSSPLSVRDFLKGTAILGLSSRTVRAIAPYAECLALSEGLHAHALAAKLRKSPDDHHD